jgi:molecular chaperone DnaK
MPPHEPVIGIDLGTTNSVVATVRDTTPTVIPSRFGSNLTPSIVAFAEGDRRIVGQMAKRQAITNAANTAYAVKRLIGRTWSSEAVQQARKVMPYSIIAGDHDDLRVRLAGKDFSVPELSAMVLTELKMDAEAYLGREVSKAVITVPAHFSDSQRQATKDAGRIAGLDVLRVINEPTAAALAYGFAKAVVGRVVVFDLGGGTFDVSILEIANGVFEVIGTGGDTYLGGEDFDNRIVDWLVAEFEKEHHIDLRKDRMALQRLKDAAEKAKCELSTVKETQINLPFLASLKQGSPAIHLQRALTQAQLQQLTHDLVERCVETMRKTLAEAKVSPKDIKELLLVGGMTRMPLVVESVKKFLGRDPCKGVHPDEVVALGAALQASALTAEESNVLLLDVTPHSLGLAVAGGYARSLIPKNTTVPTSATEVFTTSKDYQTTVKIIVLQGESEVASQNELLGEFVLSELRSAKRGEVEIEVSFDISADGIVSVAARDKQTGQRQSITVTASGGLTPEELKKIMEEQSDYLLESKSKQEIQKQKQELADVLRQVEELFPRARRAVSGSSFGMDAVLKVEQTISAAREAIAGSSSAAIDQSSVAMSRTLELLRGMVHRGLSEER